MFFRDSKTTVIRPQQQAPINQSTKERCVLDCSRVRLSYSSLRGFFLFRRLYSYQQYSPTDELQLAMNTTNIPATCKGVAAGGLELSRPFFRPPVLLRHHQRPPRNLTLQLLPPYPSAETQYSTITPFL